MARVWILAAATALGCILIYLTIGFMGVPTMKFAGAIIGAGAAAAYLPGGNSIARGMFLLLGVVFGSLSFLLGAVAFPDTNVGLLLGALVPILFSALAATFTRSAETFLVMLLGAGSMGALYTTDFFLDPQSINFTLPIAMSQVMVAVSLGYALGVLAKTFSPQPKAASAEDSPPEPDEPPTDESAVADESGTDASQAVSDETAEVTR
jgi:hypothetical protein